MPDSLPVALEPVSCYPVLLCASGMSPAIITETLFALITRPAPFLPREIHVVTTALGRREIFNQLLDSGSPGTDGPLRQLLADWWPADVPPPRFGPDTVHLIGEQDDIDSPQANRAAGDCMFNTFLQLQRGGLLRRDAGQARLPVRVHASIAGGRKTMSFLMGHVFSLLAEPADELSHVLVNPPFESVRPTFYFKPRRPHEVEWEERASRRTEKLSTADAQVELGLIPALKLGQETWMPARWRDGTTPAHQMGLSVAVRLFNARQQPERLELEVVVSSSDPDALQGRVRVCGVVIELVFVEFAWLVVFALLKQNSRNRPGWEMLDPDELSSAFWDELPDGFRSRRRAQTRPQFASDRSDLEKSLRNHIGAAARHYAIQRDGTRPRGRGSLYHLVTPVELFDFLDGDVPGWQSDWWRPLRKHVIEPRKARLDAGQFV